jgi:hypothetical protein
MAGPWFVDPDNGLTTNNGLSASAPWKLIPGQTGASAQTGYGVTSGDTINVKNGSTTALQIVPPTTNLTYRGYGLASNVLHVTLPGRVVTTKRIVPVAREWGTHEGMWTISGCTSSTCIDTSTRSGVTFEDVSIVGNSNQTSRVVAFAASSQNSNGLTLRRFQISNAPQAALSIYSKGATIEWGRIVDPVGDGIIIGASVANSLKTGTRDTLRYLEINNPGASGAVGDAIQTLPTSNQFEGGVTIHDLYVRKTTSIKQVAILSDCTGGISLKRFHFEGPESAHCQIGVETLKGTLEIADGYVKGGGADNALVRFVTSSGTAAATDSLLKIKNVIHDAEQSGGLFTAASVTLAATADGAVEIENCVSMAQNTQGLSYSGAISFNPGALLTIGANMSCKVRNNLLASDGQPVVRLPTGKANDAAWIVSGNSAQGGGFTIGATTYADVAEFEAAHSAAVGNTAADPLLAGYRPKPGSPLIDGGASIGYGRDIEGKQGKGYIGAYCAAKMKEVV